jgi:hypothetical protein
MFCDTAPRCGLPTAGFRLLSDFVLRISDLPVHFPEIDLAWRIIHSSFFGRASAP